MLKYSTFLKKREEMEGGDAAKILGIPEGDPMFIFGMIQGRTRPLRSFMDGGCSSWLAKNGVPENELKSIKLKQGPLKMFVAGDHTQYAVCSHNFPYLMDIHRSFEGFL